MSDSSELQLDIASLPQMTADELQTAWHIHLGGAPPSRMPKSLLAKLLAYRVQVQCWGGLSRPAVRFLDGIADDLAKGREPAMPYPDDRRLKPGSVLIREHDGIQHRVIVLDEGYAWNGKAFASLSAVAKAITGTNWNGQRFFGLDRKKNAGGAS